MFLLLNFQRVQDEYTSGGWTKHHTQRLEYEESNAENAKPSVLFNVTEPGHEKEKNWEVTIISADSVSYTQSLLFIVKVVLFPPLLTLTHLLFLVLASLYVVV